MCALCQSSTDFSKETPVHLRTHYIDGAGQLCQDCYDVISENKEWHNLA
jgi:hypothetical protein